MTSTIKQLPGTTIWFVPAAAAQDEDYAFECHNLATLAGRQSAPWDRGTSARDALYAWTAFVQFIDTPVADETVDIYLKPMGHSASATAHPANDDGVTEGAVSSADKTKNLDYLGSIVVDELALNIPMTAHGTTYLTARGYQVVFWNASADGLTDDVDENGFFMTPIPDQGQDT